MCVICLLLERYLHTEQQAKRHQISSLASLGTGDHSLGRKNQESAHSKLFSLNFSGDNGLPLLNAQDKGKERAGVSSKANLPLFYYSREIHNMKYKRGTP